jgi:hypothetical protein
VQVNFFVVFSVLLLCLLHGFILIVILLLTVKVRLGAAVTKYRDCRAHRERSFVLHNAGVLTDSLEQSPSREACCSLATQDIPCIDIS